jgi:hypothetical protein
MKELLKIASPALGLLLLLIYLLRSAKRKSRIKLEQCIFVFLTGPGVVIGCVLLVSAFYSPLLTLIDDYQIYVGVAGITVIYVSIAGIWKYLRF